MHNPSTLRRAVDVMLKEAEGGEARDGFAAVSLAMVRALMAATGALAASQKEVQG